MARLNSIHARNGIITYTLFSFLLVLLLCSTKPAFSAVASPADNIVAYTNNNYLSAHKVDGDTLWIGFAGELRAYDFKSKSLIGKYDFGGDLFLSYISGIEVLGDKVWVAASGGLAALDKKTGKWNIYKTGEELPEGRIEEMHADPDGNRLWIGTWQSMYFGESGDIRVGLLNVSTGQFRDIWINSDYLGGMVVSNANVYVLTSYYGEEGTRLITFDKAGLIKAIEGGVKKESQVTLKEEYHYRIPTYIWDIAPYPGGIAVLFRTYTSFSRENDFFNTFAHLSDKLFWPLPFPNDFSAILYSGTEGDLWTIGNGTMYKLNKNWKMRAYKLPEKLKGTQVEILEHHDKEYLLAYDRKKKGISGIYTLEGNKVLDLEADNEITGGYNRRILLKDNSNNIWVNTRIASKTDYIIFNENEGMQFSAGEALGIKLESDSAIWPEELAAISQLDAEITVWTTAGINGTSLSAYKYDKSDNSFAEIRAQLLTPDTGYSLDPFHFRGGRHSGPLVKEDSKYVYVITNKGIFLKYHKKAGKWSAYKHPLSRLAIITAEGIWYSRKGKLGFLKHGSNKHYEYSLGMSDKAGPPDWFTAMTIMDNSIWLGGRRSLVEVDMNDMSVIKAVFLDDIEEDGEIHEIIPYGSRHLLLGISGFWGEKDKVDHYLWVYDNEEGRHYRSAISNHVRNINLNNLMLDGDSLWIGADEGVFKVRVDYLLTEQAAK